MAVLTQGSGQAKVPQVLQSTIRVAAHPLGERVGGKGAGLQKLAEFHQGGLFDEIQQSIVDGDPSLGIPPKPEFAEVCSAIIPQVPQTVVLADGHFLSYIQTEKVRRAIESGDYDRIKQAINETPIDDSITIAAIRDLCTTFSGPIAVRSSAKCEDSSKRSPFAGSFATKYAVINGDKSYDAVVSAIKAVYTSMFRPTVVDKMQAYGLNPAEQTMAVVIQSLIGEDISVTAKSKVIPLYAPTMSAVLASRSVGMQRPEDISRDSPFIRIAFGLGTWVVGRIDGNNLPNRVLFSDKPNIIGNTLLGPSVQSAWCDTASAERAFLNSTQYGFDSINPKTGEIVRLEFDDLDRVPQRYNRYFSYLADGTLTHFGRWENDNRGDGTQRRRATFVEFVEKDTGRLIVEFLGRMARKIKQKCGFDVDMEIAIKPSDVPNKFIVALVQLRPFGILGTESIRLSKVNPEALIASTQDCVGHGVFQFGTIILVKEEAVEDRVNARKKIDELDRELRKRREPYLVLGPNIKESMGGGSVYGGLYGAGAFASYHSGTKMSLGGTHMHMELVMTPHIQTKQELLEPVINKAIVSGARPLCKGVFVLEAQISAEFNDITGEGQIFFK